MFCKNCGKQIVDHAAFCQGCGTKVATNNQPAQSTATQPNISPPISNTKGNLIKSLDKPQGHIIAQVVSAIISIIVAIYIYGVGSKLPNSQKSLSDMLFICFIVILVGFIFEIGLISYLLTRKIVVFSNGLEVHKGLTVIIFVPFNKIIDYGITSNFMFGKVLTVKDNLATHKIPIGNHDESIKLIEEVKNRYYNNE